MDAARPVPIPFGLSPLFARRWMPLVALASLASASACGSEDSAPAGDSGCNVDTDCKGGRVCAGGQCVEPGTGATSGAGGTGGSAGSSGGVAGSLGGSGAVASGGIGGGAGGAVGGTGPGGAGSGGTGVGGSGATGSGGWGGIATGPPIDGLTERQWTWVPFPGAHCRNGAETGIGVSPSASSSELVIYLEGGGACFDAVTCMTNPDNFGAGEFDAWKQAGATRGIFDRNNGENPFRDWSQVYVPYCTGDVHSGANPNGNVLGPQQFVGYTNMTQYLNRIAPTFPAASRVVITGTSAGGFGSATNYHQTSQIFAPIPVDMLDDSGPPMSGQYIPPCLQEKWRTFWGMDQTILAACGAACPNPSDFVMDFVRFLASTHADRRQALIESTQDSTISFFFGLGQNNCSSFIPTPLPGPTFEAGLMEARSALQGYPSFATFIFQSSEHTRLADNAFYSQTAGGVRLVDWTVAFLAGTAGHVGP